MSESLLVQFVWLIPALPLGAAILTAILGPRVLRDRSHWPCVAASCLTALLSFLLLVTVATSALTVWTPPIAAASGPVYEWIGVADFNIPAMLRVDPLTSLMLLMVTWVGSLIVVYSIGYMRADRGY